MSKLAECVVCAVIRSFAGYLIFGLLFGLVALIVAACIAWPSQAMVFGSGLVLGIISLAIIHRLPPIGRTYANWFLD